MILKKIKNSIKKYGSIKPNTKIIIKVLLCVFLIVLIGHMADVETINQKEIQIKELKKDVSKLEKRLKKYTSLKESDIGSLNQEDTSTNINEKQSTEVPMCALDTGQYSYESGDIAWKVGTKQQELSLLFYVNDEGHYMIDEYYCIALGSYYGEVGTKYIITMSSGYVFKAIKFDEKADKHTNNGCSQKYDSSILEFVLNYNKAFEYYGGDKYVAINLSSKWNGNIVKIEKEH